MITVDTLLANPQLRKGAGWRGAVTHCRKGHPYTPENTCRNEYGCRECRTCRSASGSARGRAWRLRNRKAG